VGESIDKDVIRESEGHQGILIYQMPQGDWAASATGIITDGFRNKEAARTWAYRKLREYKRNIQEVENGNY